MTMTSFRPSYPAWVYVDPDTETTASISFRFGSPPEDTRAVVVFTDEHLAVVFREKMTERGKGVPGELMPLPTPASLLVRLRDAWAQGLTHVVFDSRGDGSQVLFAAEIPEVIQLIERGFHGRPEDLDSSTEPG